MGNTSGLAITSLILGILAFILIWIPVVGQILAILALVFGIMVLIKIKKDPNIEGKAMAIVGIVLGSIAILYSLILLAGFIAYFNVLSPQRLLNDNSNVLPNNPNTDNSNAIQNTTTTTENSVGPTSSSPNSCVASTGFKCTKEWDDGTGTRFIVRFENEVGSYITVNASRITSKFGCKVSMICPASNYDCNQQILYLPDLGPAIIKLDSCPFKQGSNAVDLRIEYLNEHNGLNEVAQFNIIENIN